MSTEELQPGKTQPAQGLKGDIQVASDKSISHRSLIFSALATGTSKIRNLLLGEDVLRTLTILNQLGVKTSHDAQSIHQADELVVYGVGLHGLKPSADVLYCGNSGTTMRLMLGLLSAQSFPSVLTGDQYLNKRPMERVIKPLTQMGAQFAISTNDQGQRLIAITPSENLKGLHYHSPVASAQVKSAMLLAGMYAKGKTTVTEASLSRDHTERMLRSQGAPLESKDLDVSISQANSLKPFNISVPGDISSAAFFIVAGLITPNSELLIRNICLNPTRTGIIDVLIAMGGEIIILNRQVIGGEEVGDLQVRSSKLKNIKISGDLIPRLVDEIPVLSLAGALAEGKMIVVDAKELRVKETDRIKAICAELTKMGVAITEKEDGFEIQGGKTLQVPVSGFCSYGDHRMAMTEMIAGLILNQSVTIDDVSSVKTSFPNFFEILQSIICSV